MTAVSPSPSGLPAVDRQWGGFAQGHAYLLVGRSGAGRSALALQVARAAVDAGERCLVISPREPESLVEIAREIGLDLAAAHGSGKLRLLRIPSAADLAARGPEGLAKSYRDLAALVADDRPGRVIVEDFTPLVQFDTFERFHDAFSDLVDSLRKQDTTLIVGLGDPANDASRRLLGVVAESVDGTIQLDADGRLSLSTPESSDQISTPVGSAAVPSADPAPEDAPPTPSATQDAVGDAEPQPSATPVDLETPPDEPLGAEAEVVPDAEMPSEPTSPSTKEAAPLEPDADSTPSATRDEAERPADPPIAAPLAEAVPAPPAPSESVSAPAAAPSPDSAPIAAPVVAERPPEPASQTTSAPKPTRSPGHIQETDVIAPPPADPALSAPSGDRFGYDPADAVFEQGYLADSGGGPSMPPPAPTPSVPAFAPLGVSVSAPVDAFRASLDASFAARAAGTPFLVVALRMDPSATHFDAVVAGLRSAMRTSDEILVDDARNRAAVVLPASEADDGQALFNGLQAHVRAALGSDADSVLQAIAAVTIADGQPFQTPGDLIAYAVEG